MRPPSIAGLIVVTLCAPCSEPRDDPETSIAKSIGDRASDPLASLETWAAASPEQRTAAVRELRTHCPVRFVEMVQGDGPNPLPAVAVFRESVTTLEFVLIPGGEFSVGAPADEPGRAAAEGSRQSVELSPFLICRTEVPQDVWRRVTGTDPSSEKGDRLPVDNVTWDECLDFCAKVGTALPTEVQWEVAARGGSTTAHFTGMDVSSLAGFANIADRTFGPHAREAGVWWHDWYTTEVDDGYVRASPVGSFRANQFGLFDVVGNVSEWCRDAWTAPPVWSVRDAVSVAPGVQRVVRGSFWGADWRESRSSARRSQARAHRGLGRGLRPVIELMND